MSILTRKKKILTAQTLQTALMLYHTEYMKEFAPQTENVKSVKVELQKLKDCGLGNTVNAQILSQLNRDDSPAKFIKDIKKVLPNALIVPYSDFFKVMKEYNLAVGLIDHYKKVIPEENVNQIYEATLAIQSSDLGRKYILNGFQYISEISIDKDLPKKIVKKVVDYVSRFPLIEDRYSFAALIPELKEFFISSDLYIKQHIRVQTVTLGSDAWLIAAPVSDIPDNVTIKFFSSKQEEKMRQILQDPIVFKATSAGVVIASMWGEEADSSIFDKYR